MTELYRHSPLKLNHLRLLRILPSAEEDRISCELSQHSFDHLPEYSALSYAWGDEPASQSILIDGHILTVRPNLHVALKELRSRPPSRLPEDPSERSHQVSESFLDLTGSFLNSGAEMIETDLGRTLTAAVLASVNDGIPIVGQIISIVKTANELELGSQLPDVERALLVQLTTQLEVNCHTISDATGTPLFPYLSYIWIDAICIDQSNVPERIHEVRSMFKIYSEASICVVWLGVEDDFSKLAFSLDRDFEKEDPWGPKTKEWLQRKSFQWTRKADQDLETRFILFFPGRGFADFGSSKSMLLEQGASHFTREYFFVVEKTEL